MSTEGDSSQLAAERRTRTLPCTLHPAPCTLLFTMIIGLGIDIVELARIKAVHDRHTTRFTDRILTPAERAYVLQHKDPTARLAGRWAAKEAGLKALGTGLAEGIRWQDVEILPDELGKPTLFLHGAAAARANLLKANRWHVSITHSQEMAMAQVILEAL